MQFLLLVLSLLAFAPGAHANIGEAYGLGSANAALSGAGVARGYDAFAVYQNPALLPLSGSPDKRFTLSVGLLDMVPKFTSIQGVVIENSYVSDQLRSGNVDTSYRSTLGQELGMSYRLWDQGSRVTLGLATFLPLEQLAYMDTGEAYIPEYVLYRARTQRPQIEFGLGAELSSVVRVGFGLHTAFSLTANASVFLQATPGKPSSMRFTASMKPKLAPYLGVLVSPSGDPDQLSLGAVIRFPATSDNTMVLASGARLFGSFAALDFNFKANSAIFYDPWTLELGTSWQHHPGWRLNLQLDYQAWRLFQTPALTIQDPSVTDCAGSSCGIVISGGKTPSFDFQNIVIPRVAEEIALGSAWTLRAGYAYRPSILRTLPSGPGNLLDPPKHMISAGLGADLQKLLGATIPMRLDLHLAWQHLVTQTITKTPGDETGSGTGDLKIGAPGYQAGGNIWGGGASVSLLF